MHRGEAVAEKRLSTRYSATEPLFAGDNISPFAVGAIGVLPAWIIAEGLRPVLSCAGLVYIQVVRRLDARDILVRGAALEHRLPAGGHTLLLTVEQLALALPLADLPRNLATCDLIEIVEEHAHAVLAVRQAAAATRASSPQGEAEAEREAHQHQAPTPARLQSAHEGKRPVEATRTRRITRLRMRRGRRKVVPVTHTLCVEVGATIIEQAYARERVEAELLRRSLPRPSRNTLLHAALLQLAAARQAERDPRRRRLLRHQELQMRRALHTARTPHVEVIPLYQPGRRSKIAGCTLSITLTEAAAA